MVWTMVKAAVLTGVFCALFSGVVGFVAQNLSMTVLIGLSFVSGFCGSLFAQTVLGRAR